MHQLNVLVLGPPSFVSTIDELKPFLKFNPLFDYLNDEHDIILFHKDILKDKSQKLFIDNSNLIKICVSEQKELLDKLYPESCVILKKCQHSPHTENPEELCITIFRSYKKMKNIRKHIKIDVKTIENYFADLKHLENFKTSFNPEYTKRITNLLYKKYYLL